jgi:hypothetical protein
MRDVRDRRQHSLAVSQARVSNRLRKEVNARNGDLAVTNRTSKIPYAGLFGA